MSYFKLEDNKNTSNDKIKYIYPGTGINKLDITERTNDSKFNSTLKPKPPKTEGKLIPVKKTFYSVNFSNREPNFIYAGISPSAYIAGTLYMYGLLHRNIIKVTSGDTNILGEIVIEHSNANKQAQKVYTCFLVQENVDKMTDNSIDTLIKIISGDATETSMNIELSTMIPKQTECIHYVDKKNHVFIFTKPISVNKEAAEFFKNKLAIDTKLFSIYPSIDYQIIKLTPGKKTTEKFTVQEGMDGGEIYIDCQPTGESDETIQAYAVPINSAYGESKNQIDFFKMMTNFGVFLIISIITYFSIPPFYKHIVVDKFNRLYGDSDKDVRHNFIYIADVWILLVVLISIVDAFYGGIAEDGHYSLIQYGLGLCVILIVAFALIQMNKLHTIFMTTDGTIDSTYPDDIEFSPSTGGIYNIGNFFLNLYLKPLFDRENFAKIISLGLFVLIVPYLFLNKYASETIIELWKYRILFVGIFVITPAIYLAAT